MLQIFQEYRALAEKVPDAEFDIADVSDQRYTDFVNGFWHQTRDHEKRLGFVFFIFIF